MSEQGSRRYPRSFRALIASMIVLVAVVVGFWALTSSFSDAIRGERTADLPTENDWTESVRAVQSATGEAGVDFDVVYPAHLPPGWYANSEPRFENGEDPMWQLGFVDGDEGYVGIQQSGQSPFTLVQAQVDEDAEKGDRVHIDTRVADTWTSWSDAGGDHALTTEADGMTLMVWGPDEDDLHTFLEELTTAPLG